MRPRLLAPLLGLLLGLTSTPAQLLTAPAHAGGFIENCKTSAGATLCARLRPGNGGGSFGAGGFSYGGDGTTVDIVKVQVQRRTADGWRTVRTFQPSTGYDTSDSASLSHWCSDIRAGKYRARQRTRWITAGSYSVAWTATRAVRRSRLC
jgi:hypothetical protein